MRPNRSEQVLVIAIDLSHSLKQVSRITQMTRGGWKTPSTIPREAISAVAFFSTKALGVIDGVIDAVDPAGVIRDQRLGGFRF